MISNTARMKRFRSIHALVSIRSLFALVVLLAGSFQVCGQGSNGEILGAVTDQSGGNVVGATVTVTDVARGVSKTLTTDQAGEYVASDLTPGTYTVRVESKGFKAFERQNILLEVGKEVRVDAALQTGSQTEVVTVTEEVPLLDTTTSTLGGTLSNEIINDLPLNGRNYQNLLTLRPGTTVYPGGGPWTQTTNGARPEDTSYLVDGLSNDEAFMGFSVTNAAAVAGDAATILPIDAIQEFNTQVNPKAEFGWKPGAITSVGLKSGTNDIHGSAYAFGRSDSFDARNFFNHFNPDGTLQAKTPVELEQFGGSAGGRIIRDKLFYFGAFEARRYTVGNSIQVNAPTTISVGDPSISVPDALAGLAAKGIPFSSQSLTLLGCPANVAAPYTGCTGGAYGPNASPIKQVNGGFPDSDSSKNALAKVDYHINDHHSLSGSYFFGNDTISAEDAPELLPIYGTNIHSRAQAAAGHWAWTPNASWSNDLRIGYTRYLLAIVPANASLPDPLNTGVTNPILQGVPNVRIDGFTELGGFHNFPKLVGPDNVYDFVDQVSNLHGKHALKFGAEFRVDKVNQGTYRGGRGRIRFQKNFDFAGETPLESFLAGTPNSASLLAGNPVRHMTQNLFAGFFQDDWRISKRVTLNLGLRYELQGVPSEANNQLGNFQPSVGLEQVGKNIGSLYNKDATNFAPRVGVAWDVTGNGTTVIRAGASIVYDLLSMSTFLSQQDTNNTVTLGANVVPTGAAIQVGGVSTPGIGNIVASGITLGPSQLNWNGSSVGGATIYPSNLVQQVACGDGLTFPTVTGGVPGTVTDAGPCDIFAFDRNYKTPFVTTWTLGMQHAFTGRLSLDVAYVGNHGSRLTGIQDINQAALNSTYTVGNQVTRPFYAKYPYLEFINYYSNIYRSNYNGLQATFTGRNYHGLDLIVGYTYAHALDNQSYNWNQYLPKNSFNPSGEYGASDFDIRHRFTFSATYSFPNIKTWGQLLEGWQVNSILTLQTGQPWQSYDSSNDFSGTGEFADRWDFFGNTADFQSGGSHSLPLCTGPGAGGCTISSPGGGTAPLSATQSTALWNGCLAHTNAATLLSLNSAIAGGTGGCYASFNGKSFLLPPAFGTFGNSGRNIFRDTGFHNLDLSVSKNWKFRERFGVQFRAEMFNITNHPNFANPWGGTSGFGAGATADPSVGPFGCGCATPDVAAVNPVVGSGGARAIQFGLKLTF